ncbi:N-carbamoyl-L-amino-acid hydrolase [Paucibacter oligotrophus]|uniref:N-carbamoyl-L-amino-acid hydrolase n=1 Tax=Roseateles oligotrophus TaxID=1769250 RepID=A0A840LKP1_9BURK|nr:2-oxo-4-hydroxy-4-carboxy-5-ureidoimidazoline decarboxylase [Roseateles oligotrophus]MBB4845857.1 N-carbamoyl-L-amino-acid hydrolase [Roseateles oligotrophus]
MDLHTLNTASSQDFVHLLAGIYEHSPWVAERAAARRPFPSLAGLKQALAEVVRGASRAEQLGLIRAHPELAGKAMQSQTLTAESSEEQSRAGLTQCTAEELARIQALNKAYAERFGWPFILAVRGPRGLGLTKAEIMATFARRLDSPPEQELAECLRQIHRIAEIRLNDKFGHSPALGNLLLDWAEELAAHSEPEFRAQGQLSATYLSEAHQTVARRLQWWMQQDCGFDEVKIDAVGNVVGLYRGDGREPRRLLSGSHYDTVRNAGKYDGRLGVLTAMACVRALHGASRRLPFGIEVVAFAEEENLRFPTSFLAASALTGHFDPAWLDAQDADGIPMRSAMQAAGLPANIEAIQALRRRAEDYLGFVEVHIEQGPVLNELDLPLGVVTSINGSRRYLGEIRGQASHAGTTPMNRRHDAAAAAAELILWVEQAAAQIPDAVGTVGMLKVPAGSINVVPGRCEFSLDLRATSNTARDALDARVRAGLAEICQRRGLQHSLSPTLVADAAPSDPAWQARWARAVAALGLPLHQLPSGAGHDAMQLHRLLPQAMLFVRGGNGGISHNPLEAVSNDDAQLAAEAMQALLDQLAQEF